MGIIGVDWEKSGSQIDVGLRRCRGVRGWGEGGFRRRWRHRSCNVVSNAKRVLHTANDPTETTCSLFQWKMKTKTSHGPSTDWERGVVAAAGVSASEFCPATTATIRLWGKKEKKHGRKGRKCGRDSLFPSLRVRGYRRPFAFSVHGVPSNHSHSHTGSRTRSLITIRWFLIGLSIGAGTVASWLRFPVSLLLLTVRFSGARRRLMCKWWAQCHRQSTWSDAHTSRHTGGDAQCRRNRKELTRVIRWPASYKFITSVDQIAGVGRHHHQHCTSRFTYATPSGRWLAMPGTYTPPSSATPCSVDVVRRQPTWSPDSPNPWVARQWCAWPEPTAVGSAWCGFSPASAGVGLERCATWAIGDPPADRQRRPSEAASRRWQRCRKRRQALPSRLGAGAAPLLEHRLSHATVKRSVVLAAWVIPSSPSLSLARHYVILETGQWEGTQTMPASPSGPARSDNAARPADRSEAGSTPALVHLFASHGFLSSGGWKI